MKTKKLLAILLSLALLIGLMPAAGMLTTAVAAEETDPPVYEISFTEGEKIDMGYYSKKADDAAWVATFEYYLEGNASIEFAVAWAATTTNHTTSITLEPGRHTATLSATCSSALSPSMTAPSGASGKLYTWNLVVTANGDEQSIYRHDAWLCTKENHTTSTSDCTGKRTTADVTWEKTYSQYDFENMGKTDPNTPVYEISFTEGEKIDMGYYSKKADYAAWVATFEYYLAGNASIEFAVEWAATTQNHTTSITLEPGRHTATISATCSTQIGPNLTAPSGVSGKLYTWNLAVTANGDEQSIYRHDAWLCTKENHSATTSDCTGKRTTADVTVTTYGECDFENMGGGDDTPTSPTVYETAFDAGEKVNLGYYACTGDNEATSNAQGYTRWEVTFDYFLKSATAEPFTFAWGNSNTENATGSTVLERGLHTATFGIDVTSSSAHYPINPTFTALGNTYGTLYAWNLKVTANGVETAYYVHEPWQCSFTKHGEATLGQDCGRTTADVTSEKTLDQYNFSEMDPVCPPLSPTVYETMFDAGEKINLGYYICTGDNEATSEAQGYTRWEVTFDYFLKSATAEPFTFAWGNSNTENATGSTVLERGLHTATFGIDVTSSSAHYPINPTFTALGNTYGTLYAWNLKVTANGVETAYYVHEPWQCSFTKHGEATLGQDCGRTTADVTSKKTLDEYNFSEMGNEDTIDPATPVHKIAFDAGEKIDLGLYNCNGNRDDDGNTVYEVTFEYYLNCNTAEPLKFNLETSAGSAVLSSGRNTASFAVTVNAGNANNQFAPNLTAVSGAASGTLYAWNLVVKANGVAIGVYRHDAWLCTKENHSDKTADCTGKRTTADVTSDKTYSEYDFENMGGGDDPVVPPAIGYHFDFNSENFDSSFKDEESTANRTNIDLFHANSFTTGATGRFRYSFDYYMPEQSAIYVSLANRPTTILADDTTGIGYLQQGQHSFSCTVDTSDYSYAADTMFGFASYYDRRMDNVDGTTDGACYAQSLLPDDLYVWNVKLIDLSTGVVKRTSYEGDYEGCGKACVSEIDINELDLDMQSNTAVYAFDFTECEESNAAVFVPVRQSLTSETEYTISFDYYLVGDAPTAFALFGSGTLKNPDGVSYLRNIAEGENNDYTLDNGRHTFKAVVTREMFQVSNPQYLRFQFDDNGSSELGKLYVWNLKFYCSEGADIVKGDLLHGGVVVKSSETSNTVATVTDVPTTELTPVAQLDMHSAQYREKGYALRFIAAVKGADIPRLSGGTADYDNATMVVGDETYTLTAAGVLFARDTHLGTLDGIPEMVMTLDNLGRGIVYNIPANNLQSDAYHARYLGVNESGEINEGVVYTGVLTGIPRELWDEPISARAYVTLADADGNTWTVYGDVLTRNIMQVKPSSELSSSQDETAQAMRDAILNATNTEIPTGATVYYVSNDVDDETAEKGSIDNPFTTLDEVNALSEGTEQTPIVVLFERGCEWRGPIKAKNYTTYGAYGSGDKPTILGSWMNYATLPAYEHGEEVTATGESGPYWQQFDAKFGNRWQLVGLGNYLSTMNPNARTETGANVGNVLFFDDYGMVNGSRSKSERIYQDYEFYHKVTTETDDSGNTVVTELGDLYVYLPEGKTPADFTRIEIADDRMLISGKYEDKSVESVTIDNLCLMYTGGHGISMTGTYSYPVNNVTVTNCEIGWIGGSMLTTSSRYGNGIQFYGPCNTVKVTNNWIYQCYDAGYTNQGTRGVAQNITVSENLIEYCAYSLELWMDATTGRIKNAEYSDNLMRFAGYEFERDNRVIGAVSHVNFMYGEQPCDNVTISGNTFDTSYVSLIVVAYPNSTENIHFLIGPKKGPTITGNTWIQGYDRYSCVAYQRESNEASDTAVYLPATSAEEMLTSVNKIDLQPREVVFSK